MNQKDYLLSVPEEKWDERWLRNLHLYNVVIQDAGQCSTHMPAISIPVNLENFYQLLVDTQQESLSKLLAAYAKQDAAAVFRLAEISNLDLANNFSSIIIDNCDQAPFYALIKQQALLELDRIELWAALLSESALRSSVVSEWMMKDKPLDSLNTIVSNTPKRNRWYKHNPPFNSFYTQCLTIALNGKSRSFPMLKLMYKIPPPIAINLYWNTSSWLYLTGLLFPVSMIVIFIQNKVTANNLNIFNHDKIITLFVFITFYSAIINLVMTKKMTSRVYLTTLKFPDYIFNLKDVPYTNSTSSLFLNNIREKFVNKKLMVAIKDVRSIIFKIRCKKNLPISEPIEES
jgi:hypothetical protein